MENINVYFVGTAGSGKTTMTKTFLDWMKRCGYDAIAVNLDPGVETLPYSPEVDIREWIVLSDIMNEYSVGPNAAQIIAADMLALKCKDLKKIIDEYKTNYILIDTPGQIELFVFRDASRVIVDVLNPEKSVISFLFDPYLARTPNGFASLLLLCASVQFRFNVPLINVLAKTDLLSNEEIEKIVGWGENYHNFYSYLQDTIAEEKDSRVFSTQINMELLNALENVGVYKSITPVSAKNYFGFEDIYNIIQQTFMGGEDLTK